MDDIDAFIHSTPVPSGQANSYNLPSADHVDEFINSVPHPWQAQMDAIGATDDPVGAEFRGQINASGVPRPQPGRGVLQLTGSGLAGSASTIGQNLYARAQKWGASAVEGGAALSDQLPFQGDESDYYDPGSSSLATAVAPTMEQYRQLATQREQTHPMSAPESLVTQGISLAPYLAGGVAAGVRGAAAFGALTGAVAQHSRAMDAQAPDVASGAKSLDQAMSTAANESAWGGFVGAVTAAIPGFGRVAPSYLQSLFRTALAGGAQSVASDLIAKGYHDDPKSAGQIVADAAVQATVGGVLHSIFHLFEHAPGDAKAAAAAIFPQDVVSVAEDRWNLYQQGKMTREEALRPENMPGSDVKTVLNYFRQKEGGKSGWQQSDPVARTTAPEPAPETAPSPAPEPAPIVPSPQSPGPVTAQPTGLVGAPPGPTASGPLEANGQTPLGPLRSLTDPFHSPGDPNAQQPVLPRPVPIRPQPPAPSPEPLAAPGQPIPDANARPGPIPDAGTAQTLPTGPAAQGEVPRQEAPAAGDVTPPPPRKPAAPARPFSRPDLQQQIKDLYSSQGGGVPTDVHAFASELQDPFTFKRNGPYASEAKAILQEGGKDGTAMARSGAINFTGDASRSGGEDAINAFVDRYGPKGEDYYWALARERAGVGFQDALDHARNNPDPYAQLLAAIHDNLPPAGERPKQQIVSGQDIPTDHTFELNGHQMRVVEDEDGIRVLRDGDDYPVLPVDELPRIPIDKVKGKTTLQAMPEPELGHDDPFGDLPSTAHELDHARPTFFNSDEQGLSQQKPGLFGQPVFDAATGNQQGSMFDTGKPPAASAPIAGSKSALDPKNTAAMFPAPAAAGGIPLPPLHADIQPGTVQRAWDAVSSKYPELAKAIKGIEPLDSPDPTRITASYNPVTGILHVSPDRPLSAVSLGHEFMHVEQGLKGMPTDSSDPLTYPTDESFDRAIEKPARDRGAEFAHLDQPLGTPRESAVAAAPRGAIRGSTPQSSPRAKPPSGPRVSVQDAVKPATARDILFGPGSAGESAANAATFLPKAVAQAMVQTQGTVAPQTRNQLSRLAADSLRGMMARNDMGNDRDMARFEAAIAIFDRLPRKEQAAFHDAAERGEKQPDATLQPIADALRSYNDGWLKKIRSLGTGKLQQAIENYVGRIWQDPEKATSIMAQIFAKKPLEGSKGFLKQRSYEYYTDGLAAGLEPVTWNPVEQMLMKGAEMRRYYETQSTLQAFKAQGNAKFFKIGAKDVPEGWRHPDDKMFEVWAPPVTGVKEAFDAGMRQQLMDYAKDQGINAERKMSLGRGKGRAWGLSYRDQSHIISRFGGPDFVIAHEIGHALEDRHNFLAAITSDPDPQMAETLKRQMNDLADARFEHDPDASASFREYVRDKEEKAATVVQAYIAARQLFQHVAPDVLDRFERYIAANPAMAPLSGIRPSLTLGVAEGEKSLAGPQLVGHYHVPGEIASLYDNMLAPGILAKSGAARVFFGANSIFTGLNLGLSLFHATGTAIRSMTTELGRGLVGVTRGDLGTAAGAAISTPIAPALHYARGGQVIKEWYKAGSTNPEVRRIVEQLASGGFRPTMDRAFKSRAMQEIARAWRAAQGQAKEGTPGAGAAAAANAVFKTLGKTPGAVMQAMNWAVLEHIVPRLKSGAAYNLMRQELARLPAGASQQQVAAVARRVVDMVDNRFGQLVYDNLFWPKWAKESAMMAQRATGWNLGTVREWGGAAIDAAATPHRAYKQAKGTAAPENDSWFTHRMGGAAATLLLVGAIGGMLHRLMTGKNPEHARDFIYPQTGDTDDNGHPVRLSLPTDLKDVGGYISHPLQTLKNKTSPLIGILGSILSNKDYWGTQVYNEDDTAGQKAKSIGKFAAQSAIPFSYQSDQRLKGEGATPGKRAMSYLGVQQMSPQYSLTPAEAMAQQIARDQMPIGGRTQFAADQAKSKNDLSQTLRHEPTADWGKTLQEAGRSGKFSQKDLEASASKATELPLVHHVEHMSLHDALRVWQVADAGEQHKLQAAIVAKIKPAELAKMDPADAPKVWEALGDKATPQLRAALLRRVADSDSLTPAEQFSIRQKLIQPAARKAG
jgi:hypothetical protein